MSHAGRPAGGMALLMRHSAHDHETLALLIGHRCDECLSIYVGSTRRQCQAEAYLVLGSFLIKHCQVVGNSTRNLQDDGLFSHDDLSSRSSPEQLAPWMKKLVAGPLYCETTAKRRRKTGVVRPLTDRWIQIQSKLKSRSSFNQNAPHDLRDFRLGHGILLVAPTGLTQKSNRRDRRGWRSCTISLRRRRFRQAYSSCLASVRIGRTEIDDEYV